jgi:hypothetical protein
VDAGEALTELTRLSSEIDRAAVVDEGGGLVAATPGAPGARLARAAHDLLRGAASVRRGAVVDRVEVALPAGSVFAVRGGGLVAVATTAPEPASALVVHDLRECLARIGAEAGGDIRPARGAADA